MKRAILVCGVFFLSIVFAAPEASASSLVSVARGYMDTNPTGLHRRWCARFINLVLKRAGHKPSNSDLAKDFQYYGRRISGPQFDAIAVMNGHVGLVEGVAKDGKIIVISGNHKGEPGHKVVGVGKYDPSRIIAYVVP